MAVSDLLDVMLGAVLEAVRRDDPDASFVLAAGLARAAFHFSPALRGEPRRHAPADAQQEGK